MWTSRARTPIAEAPQPKQGLEGERARPGCIGDGSLALSASPPPSGPQGAPGKTWETFEHDRMPMLLRQQMDQLAQGDFVERGVNVLAFGLPGAGKTHALCAIGHRLVESGRSVIFAPAYRLVQDLLAAKRDLALPRQLRVVKGGVILYRRGGGERSRVALQNRTTRRLP